MKVVEIKDKLYDVKEDVQEMLEIGGAIMHSLGEICEESEEGFEDEERFGMRNGMRRGRRGGRRMGRRGSSGGYGNRQEDDPMFY